MKKKGFTLVELLVVIAILAILATVSIVGYTSFIGKANKSNVLVEATEVRDILTADDIQNKLYEIKNDAIVFASRGTNVYAKTKDAELVTGKTYYVSDGAATPTYTAVDTPDKANLGNYFVNVYEWNDIAASTTDLGKDLADLGGTITVDVNNKIWYTDAKGEYKAQIVWSTDIEVVSAK